MAQLPNAKPCPFCGGTDLTIQTPANDDLLIRTEYILCWGCKAKGPILSHEPITVAESGDRPIAPMIEAWNRRADMEGPSDGR